MSDLPPPSNADAGTDDELAFLRRLEQVPASTIFSSSVPNAGEMEEDDEELAFLRRLEQSPTPSPSPGSLPGVASATAPAADTPASQECPTEETSPVSEGTPVLPLPLPLRAAEHAGIRQQLNAWLNQCPAPAERLLAYLSVFYRLGREVHTDTLYITLRELGLALADCLAACGVPPMEAMSCLTSWATLLKSSTNYQFQLKIPFPGAPVEQSWMHASLGGTKVYRTRSWAVLSSNSLVYPAEIE